MVDYMKGTRSTEELISIARGLSYNEQFSYTQGWNNNIAVNIINLALNKIYSAFTQIDSPPNVEEVRIDVVSRQQAYDLPINVQMALRLVDVRYLFGTQEWEFVPLTQGTIQDRFGYPTNIPSIWCLRDGQILLSPTPNISKPNALIINYQKRMRKMDIRRGFVGSISQTSPSYIFNLQFTPLCASPGDNTDISLTSIKNVDMEQDASSVLDKVDYVCFVDANGVSVMDAVPITRYNSSTFELYTQIGWVPDAIQLANLSAKLAAFEPVYVVQGDYSSTHSQLDRMVENALIEIMVLRFLVLSSSAEQSPMQVKQENEVISYLINQYRRYRPTVYSINWQDTNQSGRNRGRGYYNGRG